MERRVLLAIALSFAVLFVYQTFLLPPPPASRPSAPTETGGVAADAPGPSGVPDRPTGSPQPRHAASAVAPPDTVLVGEGTEREITVETRTVRAVFTNRGGRLRHWILKHYRNEAGQELDLVPAPSRVREAYTPFSLRVEDDPALTSYLNGGLYRSDAGARVSGTDGPVTLTFDWQDSAGVRAVKQFTLQPDGYVLSFSLSLDRGGEPLSPAIEWGPGLGDEIANAPPGTFFAPSYSTPAQALFHRDGAVARLTSASAEDGAFLYAGIDDHYFAALVLNDQAQPARLRFEHTSFIAPGTQEGQPPGRYAAFSVRYETPPREARFFFGPKAFDDLRALDNELVRVINFGIFSWLAVPLLGALKWVHQYVGNWGWSIIGLTILINLAMFPLRQKSMTSMRKMQEVQPQLKAIQDRYAKYKITDPERQKMNQEVMELYKAKGVNPAGGCVPMLLTFPFLFAFYAMLSQAIEIRGAAFVWWISDLSRPDPWYVTPVLMGATMFWQQKMTPTSMDPVQQRVMMMMPVMFTFMFLAYPSGLVVYWTVSNLWAIGQQYFTNAFVAAAPVPAKGRS
jgi:YidC/Oxa1 family membrane protein insertase